MTRRAMGVAVVLGILVAAAVTAGFAVFWAQDACLDAGGAVRMTARRCEIAAGHYVPLFGDRPPLARAHDLVAGVLVASVVVALFVRLARGPSPRPSA